MAESVYKVVELVGTSTESWEKAATSAVELASKSLRDLRVAEITKLDMHIAEGNVVSYRARVTLSFKYESDEGGGTAAKAAAPRARRKAKAPAAPAPAPMDDEDEAPAPAKKGARKKRK